MLFEKVIDFYYNNKNYTKKSQKLLILNLRICIVIIIIILYSLEYNIIKALSSYNNKRCNEQCNKSNEVYSHTYISYKVFFIKFHSFYIVNFTLNILNYIIFTHISLVKFLIYLYFYKLCFIN